MGENFALAYADAGADLILTARSTELLEAVGEACRAKGSTVTVVTGDVSIESDVKRVVSTGVAEHGKIDVLVNNAGIADMRGVAAEHFDTETFNSILNVDLVGAFLYARECGHQMLTSIGIRPSKRAFPACTTHCPTRSRRVRDSLLNAFT